MCFQLKAHQPKELDFAFLDIAKRALDFFEDYYQTPYPLPHSWQVALPDFSAGAMENWGSLLIEKPIFCCRPRQYDFRDQTKGRNCDRT